MAQDEKPEPVPAPTTFTRRDVLRTVGALGLASAGGAAAWGALELGVAGGKATEWHRSVCRYCGTGCGVGDELTGAGAGSSSAPNSSAKCGPG